MTMETRCWHYDGVTATRRAPTLTGDAAGFTLTEGDWSSGPLAWTDLVALDVTGTGERSFGHKDTSGWRLILPANAPADLLALLPRPGRYGGWIDHMGLPVALGVFALIAAGVLYVGYRAPGWLAPLVPQAWEDKMGDAMVGDFGDRLCHTKEGDAALTALARKLDPAAPARSIDVANIDMVNAVALPGRRIVIFDGLLKQAKNAEEVAGVLGHEMGHVRRRHTMSALLQQLGLSIILGGANSGLAEQAGTVLSLTFSRDAEHEADLDAIAALDRANISPAPTAGFFSGDGKPQKGGEDVEVPDWFSSHPSSTSRAKLFSDAVKKGHAYAPALSPDEWKALVGMCKTDPDVKGGEE